MYKINGTIEGIAPILFNHWDDPEGDLGKTTRGRKSVGERDEEAWNRVYRNGHGLYLPNWNFKKCLLQGCQAAQLKDGRRALWRIIQPVIFVDGDLLFGKDKADFLHKHPGKNSDGSPTIVRRPALDSGWTLPFQLAVMDDNLRPDDIKTSLQAAGERVGLGGWRPEYGRFIVSAWDVSREPVAKKELALVD